MTSYRETNIAKKKKIEFHNNHWCQISIIVEERLGILFFISIRNTVIVTYPVHGYARMLASLYYFDKDFPVHFQLKFTFSNYE